MALIPIHRPWTEQPQYPAAHSPTATRPVFLSLGDGVDLASVAGSMTRGTAASVQTYAGRLGGVVGLGNTALSQSVLKPPAAALNALWSASGEMTMLAVVVARAQDNAGGGGPIMTKAADFGDAEIYPYIDGNLYLHTFTTTRWCVGVAPGADLTKPHVIATTCKSGAQAIWIEGRRVTTGSVAQTPALSTTTDKWGSNGGLFLLAFWDRVLSDGEIVGLSANPWELFEPRRIWVPVSAAGGGSSILPATGSVAIAGNAPSVAQSAHLSVTPAVGGVTINGFAPTVTQSSGTDVLPAVGALSVAGLAPTISQPQTAEPSVGSVTVTGFAPDVVQASGVLPGSGALNLTGFAPALTQTAAQSIAPAIGQITLTGLSPDVAQTGGTPAPSGGLIYGWPQIKRYVVRNGRKVLVFGSEDAAKAAQAAIDKARAIRDAVPERTSSRARRRVEKFARHTVAGALTALPPVDEFTIDALQQLADVYASSTVLAELQRLQDLEAQAALWAQLRDEADDEAALLELL